MRTNLVSGLRSTLAGFVVTAVFVPLAACGSADLSLGRAADNLATRDAAADAPVECAPSEHTCACATGSYCLMAGAMCIAPQSPCPGPVVSPTCGASEHACACATGGYCLGMGMMCIAPTAPCPTEGTPAPSTCGAQEHPCTCATGQYCVAAGAMCVTPTSPCP